MKTLVIILLATMLAGCVVYPARPAVYRPAVYRPAVVVY
ncbi:hypothetical protein B0G83_10741 [Paraburkholderia sp. BL21I4N1]|nr:hypothetical protein B0G83_10741 [Paraburkholderia sp. BL21I4N1]